MPYQYKNILNLQLLVKSRKDNPIREILNEIQHPDFGLGSIDFGTITPMPPWAVRREHLREPWMREHWAVAENAGGLAESVASYDGGETLEFDTTGRDVRELMRRLSLMFPHLSSLTVDYLWASADVGKDCGMVQYQNGEQIYEYIPEPGSSAAFELAFDVFATDAGAHGLVFDNNLDTYRYNTKMEEEHEAK